MWFVFSGMGTQWCGMGRDLMTLDIFKNSLTKSHSILEKQGINLFDLIMTENENTMDDPLNSFVGIVAIQVIFMYYYIPCLRVAPS